MSSNTSQTIPKFIIKDGIVYAASPRPIISRSSAEVFESIKESIKKINTNPNLEV